LYVDPACLSAPQLKSVLLPGVGGETIIQSYIYYSKFAKDQLFDIAFFSPIANDTPVREPHYRVLKLSICHVQLAQIIFNSFKSTFIFITNTQK